MNAITFKEEAKIKPRFCNRLVSMLIDTIIFATLCCLLDYFIDQDADVFRNVVVGLSFGLFGEILRFFNKTVIDYDNKEVRYVSSCFTSPSMQANFDDIHAVEIRKRWYYQCNVVITTKSGKKKKMSVDDTDLFISKLLEINDSINVINH